MNLSRTTLTVAVPTYNGSRHIEDAVRSIMLQSEVEFDLIVSDDRSDDDTLDRIRNLTGDRARIEVNSERLGLARNWNRCVARCQTPFVTIFHQDDRMKAGHLATHVAAIGPGVGLIASTVEVIDERGRSVPATRVEPGGCGPIDRRFSPGEFLAELAVLNPLRCSAVTVRVEAIEQVGGFDPSYRYVVDWDGWIKLARSWDVVWLGRPTVDMRWHEASETHSFKTTTTDLDESLALLNTLYDQDPVLAMDKPRAIRRLARAFLNRAYDAARSRDPPLCRHSIGRAVRLWPGVVGTIAIDPRLAARLAVGLFGGRVAKSIELRPKSREQN